MITDCPSCARQFRIYAWQLSAAEGTVQCDFCGEQFNALTRLHDEPLPVKQTLDLTPPVEDDLDEPQFNIPVAEPSAHEPKYADDSVEAVEDREDADAGGRFTDDAEQDLVHQQDPHVDDESQIREILGPPEIPRSRWSLLFWFSAVIFLFILATAQLAWFNRDLVLSKYPQYMPYVRKLCEKYECEVVRARDIQSIVILNRDVRDHPRYADTLLVNATMENQSDIIQPFPDLRLTLYNTEGQITGYRTFKPVEYLDQSINIEAGMPAMMPVHIILELTGSTSAAVSFEFNFI